MEREDFDQQKTQGYFKVKYVIGVVGALVVLILTVILFYSGNSYYEDFIHEVGAIEEYYGEALEDERMYAKRLEWKGYPDESYLFSAELNYDLCYSSIRKMEMYYEELSPNEQEQAAEYLLNTISKDAFDHIIEENKNEDDFDFEDYDVVLSLYD